MQSFKALKVYRENNIVRNQIETIDVNELGSHDVLIKSSYSSVNFKDALGATGKGAILKSFPMIAGIDVSGEVISCKDDTFQPGDKVLVTGCGLGEKHNGGFSQYVSVPSSWVIPLPSDISLKDAMVYGTAGFTAALCIHRMEVNGLTPSSGPVVVTGASGGVGSLATAMLSKAGYEVIAVSGKEEQYTWLKELGAAEVVSLQQLELGQKPLEKARFAGAIDNLGGAALEGLLRHIQPWGSVASVGLALDHKFSQTVMPFILRGVSLLGISSTNCPPKLRREIWQLINQKLRIENIEHHISEECTLHELNDVFSRMLDRKTKGRIVVNLRES